MPPLCTPRLVIAALTALTSGAAQTPAPPAAPAPAATAPAPAVPEAGGTVLWQFDTGG